jgi:outer membrane lipoprotein-sorting protein
MNPIHSIYIILIGLFIAVPAAAQQDARAKELLDKSSDLLNRSGGVSISFTLHINDGNNNPIETLNGQMFLKGARFLAESQEMAVYFDGKTQWVYLKALEEISISEPRPQDLQTLNPVLFFETYKKDSDYKYNGEKTGAQNRRVHEISIFPKNSSEEITQVDLQINPSDFMPVFLYVIFKNNLEYRIHINDYQTHLNLPDSRFVFDLRKYPQAEVNDLR